MSGCLNKLYTATIKAFILCFAPLHTLEGLLPRKHCMTWNKVEKWHQRTSNGCEFSAWEGFYFTEPSKKSWHINDWINKTQNNKLPRIFKNGRKVKWFMREAKFHPADGGDGGCTHGPVWLHHDLQNPELSWPLGGLMFLLLSAA